MYIVFSDQRFFSRFYVSLVEVFTDLPSAVSDFWFLSKPPDFSNAIKVVTFFAVFGYQITAVAFMTGIFIVLRSDPPKTVAPIRRITTQCAINPTAPPATEEEINTVTAPDYHAFISNMCSLHSSDGDYRGNGMIVGKNTFSTLSTTFDAARAHGNEVLGLRLRGRVVGLVEVPILTKYAPGPKVAQVVLCSVSPKPNALNEIFPESFSSVEVPLAEVLADKNSVVCSLFHQEAPSHKVGCLQFTPAERERAHVFETCHGPVYAFDPEVHPSNPDDSGGVLCAMSSRTRSPYLYHSGDEKHMLDDFRVAITDRGRFDDVSLDGLNAHLSSLKLETPRPGDTPRAPVIVEPPPAEAAIKALADMTTHVSSAFETVLSKLQAAVLTPPTPRSNRRGGRGHRRKASNVVTTADNGVVDPIASSCVSLARNP
eukprot:GHVR01106766.1.p1 GENE.GHVR01106766.1~~GHVR01106766.1.p1  ORF type:complete len:428 (-),score=31.68 GHVR01106766.1:64-1347(-)